MWGWIIGTGIALAVVAIALRYAARTVPREVLVEAWPGNPELVLRLLGKPR
ncbi:MAG: hypothetical protein ACRD0P_06505 [Stackebrandtia sp.]